MITQHLLLTAALLSTSLTLSAQQADIEIDSKWVDNTNLEISAVKHTVGSYTIAIVFTERQNTRQAPTFKTIMRGPTQRLLTVEAANAERPVRCAYRYTYVRGYRHPKLDSSFVYRLPYSTSHAPVMARSILNLNEIFLNGKPARGWHSWQFLLNPGDTVFAARKGTVVEVHDGAAQLESHLSASYHSDNNNVLIEHPDGTLCNYSVLEAGSIQVREGDIVYPGTPIARAGSYNEGTADTQVRMLIYFPDEKPNVTSPNTETFFEWVYYNPHFATAEGTCQLQDGRSYQAVSSPELVQAEMTKREIKQMK